jgi:hypothetical protein
VEGRKGGMLLPTYNVRTVRTGAIQKRRDKRASQSSPTVPSSQCVWNVAFADGRDKRASQSSPTVPGSHCVWNVAFADAHDRVIRVCTVGMSENTIRIP